MTMYSTAKLPNLLLTGTVFMTDRIGWRHAESLQLYNTVAGPHWQQAD
jgi:hypothetical protein